ncbi:MAG TPA: tetratricopeptide repeat protein [Phycisphaerae bacterium]|nr:tetratricopeptide repeat protein [Phycisphaerae bacterium]
MDLSLLLGQEFIGQVRPMLERCETGTLIDFLEHLWPPPRLTRLLGCGDSDVVKTALVCLGLTGTMSESTSIVARLHDSDEAVVGFSEQAIWSIWFRAGDEHANAMLDRAVRMIACDQFIPAIERLSILALRHPRFAEVYNQRAVARFLADRYEPAIVDARRAIRLNPLHFGAMATLGHCHAARGDLGEALEMYHAALQIHPRMEGIRESLEQVRVLKSGGRIGPVSSHLAADGHPPIASNVKQDLNSRR